MAPPFPLCNRGTYVRPGRKTRRLAPTLRQAADLVYARTKEREYFKTCIVGHVNCCLQCGSTLTVLYTPTSKPDNLHKNTGLVVLTAMVSRIMRGLVMAAPFPLSGRGTEVTRGCNTQMIAPALRQDESPKETRVFPNMYCWTHELLPPVWTHANCYISPSRQPLQVESPPV
ncbi:hypothetical protein PoB_001323600 [Plakobranchus ocellatus]|uniref:Uncharacterized protein n=1 Tax=Plakobranchus ocellatus TaxID=259542 RepID=A0AAV3YTJ4_9GAST|nr:hypothetical protein PoB_001323600 [Plakobranchus ocellatus]